MLKAIQNFKSIDFYYDVNGERLTVQCYKILNTKDCVNEQQLTNKFKPTHIIYKHKHLKGYYHEFKNLFIFDSKLAYTQYIKYTQLFRTYLKHYNKFNHISVAPDLIPIFIELYNQDSNLSKQFEFVDLNKIQLTMLISNIAFKDYDTYKKLKEKASQNKKKTVCVDKNVKFKVYFDNYNCIKYVNLYINLNMRELYKLLNFV